MTQKMKLHVSPVRTVVVVFSVGKKSKAGLFNMFVEQIQLQCKIYFKTIIEIIFKTLKPRKIYLLLFRSES